MRESEKTLILGEHLVVQQDWVDAKELARRLGLKPGWVRQNMNKIPHFKVGRLVRFDPDVVKDHFKSTMV